MLLRVPRDRRLKKMSLALDEIGISVRAGPDGVAYGCRGLRNDFAKRVVGGLLMEDLPAPAFHEEFETQRHEWIGRLLRILLQRRHIHNGREGSPHRMLAVALGNGVMAGSAGIIAHIVHPRPGIPVRRRILLGRLSSMVLALPALPQPLAREDESCD